MRLTPALIAAIFEERMAALIDAIDIKRKAYFELDNTPFYCLEADVSTPTARGGQTLVRLKMRNLLTSAVFDKTFKASDKFKEPDLQIVPASYLYSDGDGSHFLDQETFETLTLSEEMVGQRPRLPRRRRPHPAAQIQRQSDWPATADAGRTRHRLHRARRPRRHLQRQRHQDRQIADRYGYSRSALHKGRRKGQSLNRDRRVRRTRLRERIAGSDYINSSMKALATSGGNRWP